jgi:hypothetical protein
VRQYNSYFGEQLYRTFSIDSIIVFQMQIQLLNFEDQLQIDSINNELVSNRQLVSTDWTYEYFIYHKDSSFGYKYVPTDSFRHIRLGVDSVTKFIKGTNRYDSFILLKPDTIVWNNKKTELKEVYVLPKERGEPGGHLILYYNKKMNHLNGNINSKVDSIRKMKFYKQETTIDYSLYNEKNDTQWPPLIDVTELREVRIPIPSEVMDLIKFYQTMRNTK